MKKTLTFISALLVMTAAAFADITARKLDDGSVEATFFYGNPRASEVLLAGDFTSWQDGALPMEKGDKGFTLVKTFPAGTTVKYKFIVDGSWTPDLKAPDSVDDGFGGKNAFAELDELAGGGSDGAAKKKPVIRFGTWSLLGLQTMWDLDYTGSDGTKHAGGVNSTGLGARSVWKFSGNVTPHVPVYVELSILQSAEKRGAFNNIYAKDSLALKDGLKHLGTDLAFDPLYYLGPEKADYSYLGHFKTGLAFPWVEYTFGFKYAKLPLHNNVNWTTVDGEWDAGYSAVGGYTQWATGVNVSDALADLTGGAVSDFQAVFAPNRSADRAGNQYGLYAYTDMTLLGNHYIDFQYNGAYGKDGYDTALDHIYEADYIFGYRGKYGPITAKANALINFYGSTKVDDTHKSLYTPSSSDVGTVNDDVDKKIDDTAGNINFSYSDDLIDATVGFRWRGAQASMMYVKQADDDEHISDQLGDLNVWRAWFDVSASLSEMFSIGVNPYIERALNTDYDKTTNNTFKDKDNTLIYVKPYGDFYLGAISDLDATIDFYAETKYNTKEADKLARGGREAKEFILEEAGLKFSTSFEDSIVSKLSVMYGYDANDEDVDLHTLIAEIGLPADTNVQLGAGLRTQNNNIVDDTPFAFFIGANKQIIKDYKTVLYTQFLYGMDPYQDFGDGQPNLKLDEYTIDRAASDFWHNAAFQIGVMFDF